MSEKQFLVLAIASAAVAFALHRLYTRLSCPPALPSSSPSSTLPSSSFSSSLPSQSTSIPSSITDPAASIAESKGKSSTSLPKSSDGSKLQEKPEEKAHKVEGKSSTEPPPRGMQLLDKKLTDVLPSDKSSEPPAQGMQKVKQQQPSKTINQYNVQTPAIPRSS